MGRRWAGVLAVVGAAMAATTIWDPLSFLADDSWFYLVIGRNVADGHGITFSRTMPTNGFQPLWQAIVSAVLVVAHALGATSPTAEVRAVLLVGWAVLAVATWRLAVLLRRLGAPEAGVGLGCLGALVFLGGLLGTSGSEANLVLLAVVLATSALLDLVSRPPTAPAAIRLGLLLGVLVLSRLDTGFVAVAALVAVVVAGRGDRGDRVRAAVLAGIAAELVVGPYLGWNLLRFHHLLPIAGAIKLDRSHLLFNLDAIGITGIALFVAIAVLGALAFAGRRPTRLEAVAFLVPLAGGVASSAIYVAWAPGRFTDLDWYRMPQLLAAAVAGALAVRRLAERWPGPVRWAQPAAVVLLVPVLAWVFTSQRAFGANHDFWHPVADASQAMGRQVPPGGVIATLDYPGVVAAFSGRRVVALDGLTGDYDFQRALVRRGGECALAQQGVGWLLVDDVDRLLPLDRQPGYAVVVTSWLDHVDVGALHLAPADRVARYPGTRLSLWRIHPTCPG